MHVEAIVNALSNQGYAVIEDFLSAEIIQQLQFTLQQNLAKNTLKPANIGRLNGFKMPKTNVAHFRGDSTIWLEETDTNTAIQAYFSAMQTLKTALNQQLFLGVDALEAHFAHYPIGGFYKKHLDQFQQTDATQTKRIISSVLYLNQNWGAEDGGELRLYLSQDEAVNKDTTLDFLPFENRLVLFLSDQFWHEVRPATRARNSIAGWFKTRANI